MNSAAATWADLTDSDFRAKLADFIARNCPPNLRHLSGRQPWRIVKPWYMILSGAGLIAPAWPQAFGGMGLGPAKHVIYLEEIDRGGCPQMPEQGITNVGPTLIAWGTEEQQALYLPRILAGQDLWCQGFSEPNAGSDLASLRTEGRVEGDRMFINGHKIWTSSAHEANMMFLLVRTDKTVKKQAGISFVLTHMDQPGIKIRSIATIDGAAHFAEVFLEEVEADLSNVVGGLNNGWRVANSLLGAERIWAGSPRHALKYLYVLEAVARERGFDADPVYRDQHLRHALDIADLAATYRRLLGDISNGRGRGCEASILKIWQTELSQRIMVTALQFAGDLGGLDTRLELDGEPTDLMFQFFETLPPTIYGGSVEVHRNILSKNVLKLPN